MGSGFAWVSSESACYTILRGCGTFLVAVTHGIHPFDAKLAVDGLVWSGPQQLANQCDGPMQYSVFLLYGS